MTDRKQLDQRIKELTERGVTVCEDPEKKTVNFQMDAKMLMTISDAKLYKLMKAARKVEVVFLQMGYRTERNA